MLLSRQWGEEDEANYELKENVYQGILQDDSLLLISSGTVSSNKNRLHLSLWYKNNTIKEKFERNGRLLTPVSPHPETTRCDPPAAVSSAKWTGLAAESGPRSSGRHNRKTAMSFTSTGKSVKFGWRVWRQTRRYCSLPWSRQGK